MIDEERPYLSHDQMPSSMRSPTTSPSAMPAGQPCLVGTVSIESSERLSRLLSKRGIKHEVLEREEP